MHTFLLVPSELYHVEYIMSYISIFQHCNIIAMFFWVTVYSNTKLFSPLRYVVHVANISLFTFFYIIYTLFTFEYINNQFKLFISILFSSFYQYFFKLRNWAPPGPAGPGDLTSKSPPSHKSHADSISPTHYTWANSRKDRLSGIYMIQLFEWVTIVI